MAPTIGPAVAEGRSVAAAMDAIGRQPEAAGAISRTAARKKILVPP
jgi:F-type H+-transporting ATPase subunit c